MDKIYKYEHIGEIYKDDEQSLGVHLPRSPNIFTSF